MTAKKTKLEDLGHKTYICINSQPYSLELKSNEPTAYKNSLKQTTEALGFAGFSNVSLESLMELAREAKNSEALKFFKILNLNDVLGGFFYNSSASKYMQYKESSLLKDIRNNSFCEQAWSIDMPASEIAKLKSCANKHYMYLMMPGGMDMRCFFNQTIELKRTVTDQTLQSKAQTIKAYKTLTYLLQLSNSTGAVKDFIQKTFDPTINKKLPSIIKYEHKVASHGADQFKASYTIAAEELKAIALKYVAAVEQITAHQFSLIYADLGFKEPGEIASIDIQNYNGTLRPEDKSKMNEEKSYIYLAKNHKGDVGFIGTRIKTKRYGYTATLDTFKDIRSAMCFVSENPKDCGIEAIAKNTYFTEVHAIEVQQKLKMVPGAQNYKDNDIAQFAVTLNALNLTQDLDSVLPSTPPPAKEQTIAKRSKI